MGSGVTKGGTLFSQIVLNMLQIIMYADYLTIYMSALMEKKEIKYFKFSG